MSYYTATFLVPAYRFGVPFQKLQTFSKILFTTVNTKKRCSEFFFFNYVVTTTKVNFPFYKQCSKATTRLISERAIFAQNASIIF